MEPTRRLPAPNRDELIALGLLDPEAADANERELLLKFLMARGSSLEELTRNRDLGELVGASIDQTLRPGPRMTRRELGWRAGIDDDVILQLRQAMGLPDPGVPAAIYTEADVLALRSFERLSLLFSEAVALQLMRVAGSALAQIADAAVNAFAVNVDTPLRASGAPDAIVGRAFVEVATVLPDLARMLDAQLRHHVEAAIHQFLTTSNGPTRADTHTLSVGFMDIVGSTHWARSLTPTVHAARLQWFARAASDASAARGGRVVKLIGDEVMFVAPDAVAAFQIAADIAETCASVGDFPSLRGGIASGEVISRDGDVFGEVVHLAARLSSVAEPDSIVTTKDSMIAAELPAEFGGLSLGARYLRGFVEPIEVVRVSRRGLRAAA